MYEEAVDEIKHIIAKQLKKHYKGNELATVSHNALTSKQLDKDLENCLKHFEEELNKSRR